MTTISAKIIADSISPDGIRLTTMHLRYPRFLLAEFNTHRMFSRNSRSSRAVPVETMLREIVTDPVVPLHWGAHQKGMQADRELDDNPTVPRAWKPEGALGYLPSGAVVRREEAWLLARDHAVTAARAFHEAGYHKQVVNRLLEPFMHIDTLVSATEWVNFLALRDHPAAEPHIRLLAQAIKAAFAGSTPELLKPGEWHLPYVTEEDADAVARAGMVGDRTVLIKLSVARCARISYRPFDGEASIAAEITRHDALVGAVPMHASPAEHQATPDERRFAPGRPWVNPHEHGNFCGWRQYRKTIVGENQVGEAA